MAVNAKVASAYVDLVARTAAFKAAMDEAGMQARAFGNQMRAETQKSREAVRLLSEDIGVRIPRGLQTVISKMPMVTTAMNAAFDAVIVFALIDVVVKAGEKIYEFAKKNEDAARKNREAWAGTISSINQENDSLELTKTKLENAIAKLEHKPQNKLKEAIEEAKVAADELGRKLDEDIKKIADTLKGEQSGMLMHLLGQSGGDEAAGISADVYYKLSQISAGTYKGGTGNPTADQDQVLTGAVSYATAKLVASQKDFDTHINGVYADWNPVYKDAVKDIASLTELISGLKGMESTSSLTQAVGADKAKEGADKDAIAWAAAHPPPPGYDPRVSNMTRVPGGVAGEHEAAGRVAADLQDAAALILQQGSGPIGGTSKIALPGATLPDVKEGSVFREEMSEMFQDWIKYATDMKSVTHQLFEDMRHAVDGVNDEILKTMMGEKTNWRGTARNALGGFAKTGLETAEGSLMKLLGLGGHKKADGYHMWIDNLPGGMGAPGVASVATAAAGSGGGFWGGLFSHIAGVFGGGHALGGAVAAGVPIDVGELGIERFTPMVPGSITSNRDLRGGNTVMHIDARGTDPALTRENFSRALAATHAQAVRDASKAMYENRRRAA